MTTGFPLMFCHPELDSGFRFFFKEFRFKNPASWAMFFISALENLLISLSPHLPIFSFERSLDQVPNEPAIRDPLNFEGPGHAGLRRDIRVGIHF